jgi:hypothetical protein
MANQAAVSHENAADNGPSYQQLLQQREEENRQEVERLTAEIRALKLQLLQLTNGEFYLFFKVRSSQILFLLEIDKESVSSFCEGARLVLSKMHVLVERVVNDIFCGSEGYFLL